jgi:hypothetical protein
MTMNIHVLLSSVKDPAAQTVIRHHASIKRKVPATYFDNSNDKLYSFLDTCSPSLSRMKDPASLIKPTKKKDPATEIMTYMDYIKTLSWDILYIYFLKQSF